MIAPEVLQKYAKQIKQAKLEEFRSFLDFTAMKFRDRRKHKIENFVAGRWVLTIKTDKDGQFKKFKARWVEVFRMRRNGIFKRILPQLPAMVSALPHSTPRLVSGIFCISALARDGIIFEGQRFWFLHLKCKGDLPALVKCGQFKRTFSHCPESIAAQVAELQHPVQSARGPVGLEAVW